MSQSKVDARPRRLLDWNEPETDSLPLVVPKARKAFGDDAFTFQIPATQILQNPFAESKTVPIILVGLFVVSAALALIIGYVA